MALEARIDDDDSSIYVAGIEQLRSQINTIVTRARSNGASFRERRYEWGSQSHMVIFAFVPFKPIFQEKVVA